MWSDLRILFWKVKFLKEKKNYKIKFVPGIPFIKKLLNFDTLWQFMTSSSAVNSILSFIKMKVFNHRKILKEWKIFYKLQNRLCNFCNNWILWSVFFLNFNDQNASKHCLKIDNFAKMQNLHISKSLFGQKMLLKASGSLV